VAFSKECELALRLLTDMRVFAVKRCGTGTRRVSSLIHQTQDHMMLISSAGLTTGRLSCFSCTANYLFIALVRWNMSHRGDTLTSPSRCT